MNAVKPLAPSSIFNDVIGPVMTGPSSSHTAGPTRIGLAIHALVGGDIRQATLILKQGGSYPDTYRMQSTDKGFIGGLLGFGPDHPLLGDALNQAEKRGLKYSFVVEDLPHSHPNTACIVVRDATGNEREFLTLSTGGGMFRIVEMDGHRVDITGEFWMLFVQGNDCAALQALGQLAKGSHCTVDHSSTPSGHLLTLIATQPFSEEILAAAKELAQEKQCVVSCIEPLLPVAGQFQYDMPFLTASQALAWCKTRATSAFDLALAYEKQRSGQSVEAILERMKGIIQTMKSAMQNGMEKDFPPVGVRKPNAKTMARNLASASLADLGIMNQGMLIATAVMEYNSAGGIVVAAPTAGSCGVLPAVVLPLAQSLNLPEEKEAEAMLVAGLVGVFIAHQATFAAEVCACQAEVGSATAMAAAAAVHLLGGTVEQAFAAASLALQNVLGLICDPVAGLVEIPCINRNTMGAANAVASANMVMAGFDPTIPLDEVIATMLHVGKMLPPALRCTNKGGLCLTPTAQAMHTLLLERKKSCTP